LSELLAAVLAGPEILLLCIFLCLVLISTHAYDEFVYIFWLALCFSELKYLVIRVSSANQWLFNTVTLKKLFCLNSD
jgi:hypothetical protein